MSRLPALYAAVLALCAAVLAARFFGAALAPAALSAALLLVVFVAAAGSGRVLLRAFGAAGLSESEKTLVGATLGLGALSQLVFLLGAAALLRPWAAVALLGALWVVGFTELGDLFRSLGANRRLLVERPAAAAAVLLPLAAAFWACFVPPHQYDALVYHLPLAAAYAREGAIVQVPHLVYTHFPQNAEMLYALALLLGSDTLAQLFTWLTALLSVWWVFEMGKREQPLSVVLLACLLVSGHTAVLLLASSAYVECVVMLWTAASVFSFLRWREGAEGGGGRGWLALSGVFAGLGVGTKYSAALTPLLLGLWLLARWLRSRDRTRGLDLAAFAGTAVLAGAPWLVKNLRAVGNPFFPFFYRWLPARGVEGGAAAAARYFDMLAEYGRGDGWVGELAGFFLRAATGSPRYGGGADVVGTLGWAPLLLAVPAAVWAARRNGWLRALGLYSLAHWAAWFSTRVVLRFLVPLVPIFALPAAAGLHGLWSALGRGGRWLLGTAGLLLALVNLGLFLYLHALFGSFPVLAGLEGRREFLSRRLDYYPCARFAAERLPQSDRILLLGEQRGYYVVQPHTATSVMTPNLFVRDADEAGSPADLARRLREDRGYRWILEVPREARRLGEGYGVFSFSARGASNWEGLRARLETVYEEPGRCAVARLR